MRFLTDVWTINYSFHDHIKPDYSKCMRKLSPVSFLWRRGAVSLHGCFTSLSFVSIYQRNFMSPMEWHPFGSTDVHYWILKVGFDSGYVSLAGRLK